MFFLNVFCWGDENVPHGKEVHSCFSAHRLICLSETPDFGMGLKMSFVNLKRRTGPEPTSVSHASLYQGPALGRPKGQW